MIIAEMFRRLSYGELSDLALSNNGSGEITEGKQPQIITYANEALRALYARFVLSEKVLALQIQSGKTRYRLSAEEALSNNEDGFILDTEAEPFEDDLIKVLRVTDSAGCDRPLNDPDNLYSAYTPEPTLLEVPLNCPRQVLYLTYQAMPRDLLIEEVGQEVSVPRLLEGAVTAYIAYCVYRDMGTETSFVKSQEHLGRYETICGQNQDADLLSTSSVGSATKFEQKGFV